MRHILLILTLVTVKAVTGQQNNIVIKVQKQTLSVDIKEDNNEKTITINSNGKAAKTDKVIIYNTNKNEIKTWKRSFTIYDDSDNELLNFTPAAKTSSYQIPLSQVLLKLKKDTGYSLYTVAILPTQRRQQL
jgi:hypothetical protein